MTKEQNIIIAKKYIKNNIYHLAKLENVNVTFPQTETIIDGGICNNVNISDIETVLNIKSGWQYTLNNIDKELNLEYICKINDLIARNESLDWGVLRYGKVGISGTDYIPQIPQENEVKQKLIEINKIENPVDKALEYFCYGCKNQLFFDGNKRTSSLISNKILIENGKGLFIIKEKDLLEFNEKLHKFYCNQELEFKQQFIFFLKEKCIECEIIPKRIIKR